MKNYIKKQGFLLATILTLAVLMRFTSFPGLLGILLFLGVFVLQLAKAKTVYGNYSLSWFPFLFAWFLGNIMGVVILAAWPRIREFPDSTQGLLLGLSVNAFIIAVSLFSVRNRLSNDPERKTLIATGCISIAMALLFIFI